MVKNLSPSYLENGDDGAQNSKGRSKSREHGKDSQIFNAQQKPNKSVDLSGAGHTGLPENDDEILKQLNQIT